LLHGVMTNAQASPFPLPPWQMAELRIVGGLAARKEGREGDLSSLAAANASAMQTYPQPALRNYLDSQIGNAANRPQVAGRAKAPSRHASLTL